MITIVTRWEIRWPAEIEWTMWRQLRGAFSINRLVFAPVFEAMEGLGVDQYETMEEAIESAAGERAFLEPSGHKTLQELPRGDIALVIGNTDCHNLDHVAPGDAYKINAPSVKTHMYGINAAAIALATRYGQ